MCEAGIGARESSVCPQFSLCVGAARARLEVAVRHLAFSKPLPVASVQSTGLAILSRLAPSFVRLGGRSSRTTFVTIEVEPRR